MEVPAGSWAETRFRGRAAAMSATVSEAARAALRFGFSLMGDPSRWDGTDRSLRSGQAEISAPGPFDGEQRDQGREQRPTAPGGRRLDLRRADDPRQLFDHRREVLGPAQDLPAGLL